MTEIKSWCKGCVFAELKHGEQIACKLGRISKFKELGVNIEKQEDYFIFDRYCNAARPESWLLEHTYDDIYKELEVKVCLVIPITEKNLRGLEATVESIKQQKQLPTQIVVVLGSDYSQKRVKKVNDLIKSIGVKYNINVPVGLFQEQFECINEAFKHIKKQTYYAVVKQGQTFDTNVISNLDNWINNELKMVSMIYEEKNVCPLIVQTKLHKMLYGWEHDAGLDEKIEELAITQDREYMLLRWNELCS